MSTATIAVLTPELIIVLTATLIYVLGAFLPGKTFWGGVGLLGIAIAGFVLVGQRETLAAVISSRQAGPLAVDGLGRMIRGLALLVGALFVLTASKPQNESLVPEYVGTVLMTVAGLMLVGGARELTLLFLGLELISIPTYVLLFLGRRDGASAESSAKYFFLSILSSAITLYGFSFLYGVGGSTRLDQIEAALDTARDGFAGGSLYAQLALVLIFAGLGFKIAAVPFHFYAPDVYQGTTHPNAGLLAVLPKIAGIAALVRIASIAMPGTEATGIRVAMILALITMTLGNVTALWQTNIRRMLAYSSIAHAGYMLIGLAVAYGADLAPEGHEVKNVDGIGAAILYVMVYSLATAGTFAAFAFLGSRDKQVDTLDDISGVAKKFPATALAIAVFMFSLTGLPPLAGFWGKFELFSGAVELGTSTAVPLGNWFLVLAVVGVLNAAVSAAYYLRIIGTMYFGDSTNTVAVGQGGNGARLAAFASAILVIAVGLAPGRLAQKSRDAAASARATTAVNPAAATTPAAAASTNRLTAAR
ncbi:MAG: NADH-quinone oxidoreductase subunit N [Planctomycetaceae bacterium]|nr:NADH-quinone oxidoreductase subunit N [Planctomycetaceae bacterium]